MIVKFQRTEKAIQKDTILVDLKYDNGDIEDHISKSTDNTSTRTFLGCFLLLMKNLSHLKLIAIQNTLISLTLKMIKYLKK